MRGVWLITRRELSSYFNSMWGYTVIAVILALNGLFFNAFAVGSSPKLSAEVLEDFFFYSFGFIAVAGILLTMRLLAEERQQGTMQLLNASPLGDGQIVLGKFLSAWLVLSLMSLGTLYMPALIFINGKVSLGHIAAGYTGLLLTGAASAALGTLGSALVRSQLVAAVISAVMSLVLTISWLLGKLVDPPLDGIVTYLSWYDRHFLQSFGKGRIELEDIVFYLSLTVLFLDWARRILSSRRWQ